MMARCRVPDGIHTALVGGRIQIESSRAKRMQLEEQTAIDLSGADVARIVIAYVSGNATTQAGKRSGSNEVC